MAGQYADAKAHLKEHGWVRLPGILTKAEAASILDRLWKAKEAAEKRGDPTFIPFIDPNEHNVRVFYLMELDKVFRDLAAHPAAVDMVKSVLSESFLISNFTANIARPGSRSMCLHSDQSIVFPAPWTDVNALNIIWCLTDVDTENGATRYIPGSNRWSTRDEIPADAPRHLVPFEGKAGDVIAMDGRLWHTSGANTSRDRDRAMLFGYYTAPYVRQQVNWTAKLPRELQDELDPQMREWLGLNVQANYGVTGDARYLDVQFPEFAEAVEA